MTSAPRKLSAAGSACLRVFSEEKGRQRGFPITTTIEIILLEQNYFLHLQQPVRLVCYSWLGKQVTTLTARCSSVSPHVRKLTVILCSKEVLLRASHLFRQGERSASCGEGLQKSIFFVSLMFQCFSTGKTSTF